MKHISLAVLGILPAILSGTAHAQSFRPQITQTVGSGSNESFLVVDFQDGTVDHNYAFGYLYDGSRTGADLIAAVSSGTGLGVTYLYNGGPLTASASLATRRLVLITTPTGLTILGTTDETGATPPPASKAVPCPTALGTAGVGM